ncbi:hypothetical protein QTP88_026751 [Uroleucon formosanum]
MFGLVAPQNVIYEDDVKRRWRNLRDTFLKEKKKVKKCRSGDSQEHAEIYTGKWAYYKSLLFLKDTTTPRNTDGNISDLEYTHQENSDLSENDDTGHFNDSYIMENISLANNLEIEQPSPRPESELEIELSSSRPELETDSFAIPTTVPPKSSSVSDVSRSSSTKRKRDKSNKDFESELLKLEEQKLTALLQSNITPVIKDDEDMLFLKSLHPYFHTMNPLQKLRVRNQLQTIFINELSTQVQQPQELYASSASCNNMYSTQNEMHYRNTRIQQQINPTDIDNERYEAIPVPNFNF